MMEYEVNRDEFLTGDDPDSTIRTTLKVVMFSSEQSLEDEERRMIEARG
jgi:hypothetical protein